MLKPLLFTIIFLPNAIQASFHLKATQYKEKKIILRKHLYYDNRPAEIVRATEKAASPKYLNIPVREESLSELKTILSHCPPATQSHQNGCHWSLLYPHHSLIPIFYPSFACDTRSPTCHLPAPWVLPKGLSIHLRTYSGGDLLYETEN